MNHMANAQNKTCLSILRSALGPVAGQESRFGKMIGRSPSWVKKASCGIIPVPDDVAVRISHETGVALWWIKKGDVDAPIVGRASAHSSSLRFARHEPPFTKALFDRRRAEKREEDREEGNARYDLVLSLHALLESFHAASKGNDGPLVAYKVEEVARTLREEFGESTDKESAPLLLSICRELSQQIEGAASYTGPEIKLLPKTAKPSRPSRRAAPRTRRQPVSWSPVRGSA
jgi:hypothetical protein